MEKFKSLRGDIIAFDTETTGLNPWGNQARWGFEPARPFAYSFCDLEGNTEFIRWAVEPKTRKPIYKKQDLEFIRSILENSDIQKVGHNVGFDIRMSKMIGIGCRGKIHDTQIMMHVITGGSEMQYGLKPLSIKFLGIKDDDQKELQEDTIRERKKAKKLGWKLGTKETHGNEPIKADYWVARPEILEKYATQDAIRTMMLFRLARKEIETNEDMYNVYQREMKLFKVVRTMENQGVRVYPEEITKLKKFYEDYMKQMQTLADKNGANGMNFRSPKQMVEKFFVEKKHKPLTFTDKGSPQANADFLVSIQEKEPLAKAILEYNAAKHGIVSFLKPYESFMTKEKGVWVLHPNYKQCGPVTGRFSCSDPNLMQVASETSGRKRSAISLHPRRCFGPRPGHIWYAPDYSQIEVWIFAFQAQEKAMMKALLAGHDFHGAVAKQVWGALKEYLANASYYRKRAKLILFCKIYGGGAKKVAYLIDCTVDEAKQFISDFEGNLPGVSVFMNKMVRTALEDGKIVNPFGRTYFIDPDFSYKATNYLIQGTAADVMKNAMINLHENVCNHKSGAWKGVKLLLTLHDELIIEVPLRLHSKVLMRKIMVEMQRDSKKVGVPVPLPVSMKVIPRQWSEEVKVCDKHLAINCKKEICNKKG